MELVALSLSIVLAVLFKRGMVELVTTALHHRCGFDSHFLLLLCFRFDCCFFRLGRCCCFPLKLVAPRSCCCFDRTLGGWAWSFLSSWLPQGLVVVYWGLVPQGNLGRRRCCRARQRVSDSDLEATFGHTSIATDITARPMRANAAPRPLHSSPGTEEESGR